MFSNLPLIKLYALERLYIEHIIKQCGGNLSKAAVTLGISRATIFRKVKAYKVTSGEVK